MDTSPSAVSGETRFATRHSPALVERIGAAIQRDLCGERVVTYGVITALLATILVVLFWINFPQPFIPYHDTKEYIDSANTIVSGGWWVNAARMPGYPVFLAVIFLFTGKNNYASANAAQQPLFILAALEVYLLSYLIWRRSGLALVLGALFATNFYFLSYVKPILSDGLALCLTLGLALALVAFLDRPTPRRLWLVCALLLALTLTRAEWFLLPIPLFAILLFLVRDRVAARTLLAHAVLAVVAIYAVLGVYVVLNARVNGYAGLTDAQNINMYGKVLQYQMQNDDVSGFPVLTSRTDYYVDRGYIDPYYIWGHQLWMGNNHWAILGAYSHAIIVAHPVKFIADSIPLTYRSLYQYRPFAAIQSQRRAAHPLHAIEAFSAIVFPLFMLFPFCAAAWTAVWLFRTFSRRPKRRRDRYTEVFFVLSLLCVYDLVLTTLTSYDEYTRLHLSFDPLMLIVVVGTLVALLQGGRLPMFSSGSSEPESPADV